MIVVDYIKRNYCDVAELEKENRERTKTITLPDKTEITLNKSLNIYERVFKAIQPDEHDFPELIRQAVG